MSDANVEKWIFPLAGHEFDLEDLPYWLVQCDIQVATRKEGYCLEAPKDMIGGDIEEIQELAENQLALINGAGRLLAQDFRPVVFIGKFYGVDEAGNVVHTIVMAKKAEMREKAGAIRAIVGGEPQPDPREAAAYPILEAAKISPLAYDALVICGRPTLTWTDLYLLFELVENAVGSQMFEKSWISKSLARSFTSTANSYSVLRHEGRHGKDKGSPPSNPMSLIRARNYIQGLVRQWLVDEGTESDEKPGG